MRRRPVSMDKKPSSTPAKSETISNPKRGQSSSVEQLGDSIFSMTNRKRIVLLSIPILAAWYAVIMRRSTARPLPVSYAVCSFHHESNIFTMDSNNTREECIVIDKGLVSDVGSLQAVRRDWGDIDTKGKLYSGKGGGIKIYFLRKGQTLIPGLIDAHAHILQYGESVKSVNLVGCKSTGEAIERIASFIANDPGLLENRDRFITGLGWDQTKWPGGQFPTANDLDNDPRLRGRPIYLKRIDVHALWVSKSILHKMGSLPAEVSGGLIVRSKDGEPTGIFVDNAMVLVTEVIPLWTDVQRFDFLRATARAMLATGLTSVHDASLSLADIRFLKELDQEGRLPIRIYGLLSCEPLNSYCGQVAESDRYDGDRFTLRGVKIFTDGALGSWGAAMHEPYSDNPSERGILISDENKFAPLVQQWISKGFQVASHAIGDRANTIVIDAYEQALSANNKTEDLRLRIEHAQILTEKDIARVGQLNIISSVQPTHATSDMGYAEKRIGPERIKGAYAWQSLRRSGSRLALGSDFPVEAVSPWKGIYAAISRTWINGDSPHGEEGWYFEEALTIEQTLRGFTIDAAYASFQENRTGSLEVGKEADFLVINKNLFAAPKAEILKVKVVATIVGGRIFHGRLA